MLRGGDIDLSDLLQELRQSKILIVDDKIDNVQLLEHMLDEEYFDNVTSTTDPTRVLELHQIHQFDLILLDIRMPVMSGLDVIQALKEVMAKDDYLSVLVLTAQTDDDTKKQALEAGARDFLVKPFRNWEVMQRIQNLLETRVYFNRQLQKVNVLEEEVDRRTKEIRNTQLQVVRTLGRAAEFRDNETGMHIIRMSKMCAMIAREMGEGEQYCELLLNAAPMHDVGKIGIPDSILLKPGRLDDEERIKMNEHASMGADILEGDNIPLMELAREIAISHHEKWDGSGYPAALIGKKIPLSGRIAAVSDVFDALMSKRHYKEPWTLEQALDFIDSQTGKHFDPDVVAAFKNIVGELEIMRGQFPD